MVSSSLWRVSVNKILLYISRNCAGDDDLNGMRTSPAQRDKLLLVEGFRHLECKLDRFFDMLAIIRIPWIDRTSEGKW